MLIQPKKMFLLLLSLTSCFTGTIFAAEINLVKNHVANSAIIIPDKAIVPETFAAEELQYHIQKASGAKLPICKEKDIPVNITDEQIDQQILQQKQQEAVQKWLQPLKASADIEIIDPQVNAYDYRMQQKYEEALFEYKKALMEKNDLLLYVQIARMQDKIGNVDEGKRSLRKALILQKRLSGYRYPMLYFAAIDFFIKYKDRDLYRGLFDDVLATFKGNKVIMDIADNNYRDNMTKTQRANLDEQLALIAEQEAQTESEKQSVQNNPLSALDKLDTLTGNSLVE